MDDRNADRIKALVGGKDLRYFSENSLGDLLGEARIGRTAADVRHATRLLADCDVYAFVGAVSSGLRETAADDDEFASLVSGMADKVRYDLAQGPVIRSLIEIGKADPHTGAGLAARLVGRGAADYAAFLAGGARAGATRECDDLAASLLSSDDPLRIAAGLRLLRVARAEHGEPGADAILGAVRAALDRASDDEGVDCEAIDALLVAYGECPEGTGPMIEDLVLRRPACRPVLTSRIANRSPFSSRVCLRYLDICAGGLDEKSRDADVHDVCRALAGLAGSQPEGVSRTILAMVGQGAYTDKHGGRVLEELGREHAAAASEAMLEMMRGPRGQELTRHLPSMMRRLGRYADMQEAAGPFLGALYSKPATDGHCLVALYALAVGNHLGMRDRGSAGMILGRLLDHAVDAGIPMQARRVPELDSCAELCNMIDDLRHPGATTWSGQAGTGHIIFALPCTRTLLPGAARQESADCASPEATPVPPAAKCALALPRDGGPPDRLIILQTGRRAAA